MMKQMDDVRISKTITGKTGPWDVSQEDWEDCNFSFEDMLKILLSKLK